jgi:hypothetical protein
MRIREKGFWVRDSGLQVDQKFRRSAPAWVIILLPLVVIVSRIKSTSDLSDRVSGLVGYAPLIVLCLYLFSLSSFYSLSHRPHCSSRRPLRVSFP